ncbi:hypothetical protein [Thioclava sp. GXIMD4215]
MAYHSDLPRSFPLIVKTPPERDVYIELSSSASGAFVLGADLCPATG